eukprot:PITA_32274
MICKFCNKPVGGGGILRLKQHFARIRGQVNPCEAPNEVLGPVRAEYLSKFQKFEENTAREKAIQDEIARKRELLEAMKESGYDDYEIQDSSSIPYTNDPFHYVPHALGKKSKGIKRTNIQSYFSSFVAIASANPTSSQPSRQPTLDQHWKKQYNETCYQYIPRWWYEVDIPFNAACSPYYQAMWDFVIAVEKGFKGLTMHELRGALLQKEVSSIVDASDKLKNVTLLFELLNEIIQEVGERNVVQVIIDNASNYVLVGKMLESKYKTIFWTPCAAHYIDIMLEDIGKVEWVKNIVEHANCITKYIYNHSWVLSLMWKNAGGKELVMPAITRFATHFLTL